ncbi:MAG TPA: hypothetical protein VHP58_05085 [Alphaproteobacteria bacterium]|nr:hypothetical protein [Alphaproteobacteria bacterium]
MARLPDRLIYVCSKVAEIPLWQDLRAQGLPIISRWIDLPDFVENNREAADNLWHEMIAPDMRRATDMLVFQRRRTDMFKGALLEIGMAMGHQLPLMVASPLGQKTRREAWGTWITASNVQHCFGLKTALATLGYPHLKIPRTT